MGTKEKKENTREEVQRRIGKLESHLRDTVELFPSYNFSPREYESAVVQFLQNRQIGLHVETVRGTIEAKLLSDGNRPAYTQPQLDVMERSFRLASKVLQKVREIENPTPYISPILRALSPFDDANLIAYANRVSDIFTKDKGCNFSHAVFVEKLSELLEYYHVPKLDQRQTMPKQDYFTAINTLLDIASDFAEKYGKAKLTEDERKRHIEELESRIKEEIYNNRKRRKSDGHELDLNYLTGLAKMRKVEAITQLQSDFGILTGMDYQGNPRKGKAVAEFYFLGEDGKEAKYSIDSRGKAPSSVKTLIRDVLLELVENNHRGIVLREETRKRSDREMVEIKTDSNPDLAKKLVPYKGRLEGTRKSSQNLLSYF